MPPKAAALLKISKPQKPQNRKPLAESVKDITLSKKHASKKSRRRKSDGSDPVFAMGPKLGAIVKEVLQSNPTKSYELLSKSIDLSQDAKVTMEIEKKLDDYIEKHQHELPNLDAEPEINPKTGKPVRKQCMLPPTFFPLLYSHLLIIPCV